jgi:hypothetical protein
LRGEGDKGTPWLTACAQNVQNVQNPDPDPSFEHSEHFEQVRERAPGPAASTRGEAEEELAATVRDGDACTTGRVRVGLPEIPEEPLLLRDGRRLWRFRADEIRGTRRSQAAALIDQAHWHGAVLVADARELVVVESWLSNLPPEILCELRLYANGVMAELLNRARARACRRQHQ